MAKFLGKKRIRHLLSLSSHTSNNRGQFAIEAVLLTALLIGGFIAATNSLKERKIVSTIFSKPAKNLSNMAGYGTWKESCQGLGSSRSPQRLSNCHPNSISRALSSDPN